MLSIDGIRVVTLVVPIVLMMPTKGLAQEDQRASTPQVGTTAAQREAGEKGGEDRPRKEGASITVDHALQTSLPEPGRDNAFSMTVNQYGITATLQTLASAAGSAVRNPKLS